MNRHFFFRFSWYVINALLVISTLLAIYSIGWEYSTRRYLKGFSDAIIPVSGSPEEKVEAILNWMSHGPSRLEAGPNALSPDRDPTETLNYNALLQVCGTSTNAFVNLADSGGLEVRRLLLLDSDRATKHVTAEVLINDKWVVVDPAFRAILRGADGKPLTHEELTDPAIFAAAIGNVPGYDPAYTFSHTAHVRFARFRIIGPLVRVVLDRLMPDWENSTTVSLLAERESLVAMIAAVLLVMLLLLVRASLRWYGEKRLGMRSTRIREQIRRAFHAFLDTAS
jgi:hypothetical protein